MLEVAIAEKIRLLIEEGTDGVLRIWHDPEESAIAKQIAREDGRPCVLRETPPQIQYGSALPAFVKLNVPIQERKRPFRREVEEQRLGDVTLFGDPDEGEDIPALLKAALAARDPALSMADEIVAVADAVGSSYHINIARAKTYIYARR